MSATLRGSHGLINKSLPRTMQQYFHIQCSSFWHLYCLFVHYIFVSVCVHISTHGAWPAGDLFSLLFYCFLDTEAITVFSKPKRFAANKWLCLSLLVWNELDKPLKHKDYQYILYCGFWQSPFECFMSALGKPAISSRNHSQRVMASGCNAGEGWWKKTGEEK